MSWTSWRRMNRTAASWIAISGCPGSDRRAFGLSPGSAPGAPDRRRYSVWLVPVHGRYNDQVWVVLWQPRDDDALVAYIGPGDFRPGRV